MIVPRKNEDLSKIVKMISSLPRMRWDIIHICMHYVLDVIEGIGHGMLENGSSIFKAKR